MALLSFLKPQFPAYATPLDKAGWWALRLVPALGIDEMPRGFEIALDPVSAAVVIGTAVVVGMAIGMMPAARLWRINMNEALREEGRSGTSSRSTNLLRRGLAVAQVTIAFVLLIGAGLLLASFRNVLKIDPGVTPGNVITGAIDRKSTRLNSSHT